VWIAITYANEKNGGKEKKKKNTDSSRL